MSLSKELMEDAREAEEIAKELLFEIGAIKYCFKGIHYYDAFGYGKVDNNQIYAKASMAYKAKTGCTIPKKIHDAIHKVMLNSLTSSCDCMDKD